MLFTQILNIITKAVECKESLSADRDSCLTKIIRTGNLQNAELQNAKSGLAHFWWGTI